MKFRNLSKPAKSLLLTAVLILAMFPASLAWAPPAKKGLSEALTHRRRPKPPHPRRRHRPPGYNALDGTKVVDGLIRDRVLSAPIDGKAGNNLIVNGNLRLNKEDSLGLWELNIKLKNDAVGRVKVLRVKPPEKVPPRAIGFFKVNLIDFSDADIADANITFWVGNKFQNVHLSRLHQGTWTLLKTVKVENGVRQVKYKAVSPGFSIFAIIAEPGLVDNEPAKPAGSTVSPASGALLYAAGLLGVIFIAAGATIRVRARR